MSRLFNQLYSRKNIGKSLFLITAFVGLVLLAFYLAEYVTVNKAAQTLITQFGYGGVFLFAIVTGLSIIPIPAVTFTPVFIAGGLSLPFIILSLIAGITIADGLGFFFGHFSKSFVIKNFPESYSRVHYLYTKRRRLIVPIVCLYIAFIPLPNELVLIPLGVLSFPFRSLFLPILIGNTINQTLLAVGIQNLFWWWV